MALAPPDKASTSCEGTFDQPTREKYPSLARQMFATLFTPSWSMGLLLFVCLFLPSYVGCNGEVVYPFERVRLVSADWGDVYASFLVAWPALFGLFVTGGTIALLACPSRHRGRALWCALALIVTANLILLGGILILSDLRADAEMTMEALREIWWLIAATVVSLVALPLTALCCRSWFNAAMWLQLVLAVLAALTHSLLTPLLLITNKFLWGGQLAVACSVLLIPCTLIQRLDGQRVLDRAQGESPCQLSLRALLLLMLIGGVACAWIGVFLFADPNEWGGR